MLKKETLRKNTDNKFHKIDLELKIMLTLLLKLRLDLELHSCIEIE